MITLLRNRDEGLSLVEVIIYTMLLAVISAVAGSLLITALTSQRDITAMGSATSRVQVVASSVENGVRTASTVSVPTPTAVGQRLIARTGTFTATGSATWKCQSWLIAPDGKVYHRVASAAFAAPASLSAADLNGWQLIAEGVRTAPGAASAFLPINNDVKTLRIAIEALAGSDGAPALLQNSFTKPTPPTTTGTGPTTC